ncbi:MAG: tautomerase family protein [Myxococcaceae bacterium]|nr:tautomerase family protein [Myxococcaceae bacterium]
MQFKIYGRTSFLETAHAQISDVVHGVAMRTLQAPADKRFHRFIGLAPWQLVAPADRSERYLQLEVILFSGRTLETKKALVRALMDELGRALALAPADIEVVLIESPRENWGIRGQHGDELALSYKVDL